MELSHLMLHTEALIFASDKPLTVAEITDLVNGAFGFTDEEKVQPSAIETALESIVEKYRAGFYPFEVRQSGGGWQFLTKKDYHKTVAQLNGEKFLKRLSAAALETLAIIAYKQPITKGEIETIRGVSSDYSVQKLLEKELIIISGRNEKLPGHPLEYSTSKSFMDYFGINSPDDLPKIKEVLAGQTVEPTVVNGADFEQSNFLSVSGEGELVEANEQTGNNAEEKGLNGRSIDKAMESRKDEEANGEFIADTSFVPEITDNEVNNNAEASPSDESSSGSSENENGEDDFTTGNSKQ